MKCVPAAACMLAAASMLLVATPMMGQDVLDIVRKVDEATLKIKSITYNFRITPLEGNPNQFGMISGQAKLIRVTDLDDSPFHVVIDNSATDGPPGSNPIMVVAFDGETAYRINHEDRTHRWAKMAEDGEDLLDRRAMLARMIEFTHPTPFSDELNADSLKLEGSKEIGEVDCHVVHVVYENQMAEARWYFGKKDFLPHRVERINGGYALELTAVNPKAEIKAADFALKAPEGYDSEEYSTRPRLLAVGKEAPDFELQSGEGKTVKLSDLRGHVVLLDFWATWCPPCRLAMPGLQKLHEHFKDRKVKIIGVSTSEDEDPVEGPIRYMKEQKFTYGLLVEGDKVAEAFKVRNLPTFYLIDAEGRVAFTHVGFDKANEERLQTLIEELLEKAKK